MAKTGSLRRRVIELMDEKGSQSVNDLVVNLGISNGSSRSVLIKLHQLGKIERISKGVYQIKKESSPQKARKT